ncbi:MULTISPECIES: fimbrial biogenesis usher protein [Paraburkholderia]|uniref:fimbrial biogenesis usher protein n=1 Tax=Paraburkholderia TaxID=1822464 RepID=UPI0022511F8A|nr:MULTISPECIES: fimbrial biogenesis usher protein [Paraburkholderia]MCX4163085.1 fimbrial biogenesis usher protein [Paraburkholderia megapolitana]MDN7158581.1 fimbrial biogenesis usher protein [Paraburkholderia sp. CHISQ3]MDQ6495628.1 fimbrial biogenesis usher protein [Paraburkholderia megapolitana]
MTRDFQARNRSPYGPLKRRSIAAAIASVIAKYAVANEGAPGASFDSDILKARGLDPSVALYFNQAARFPAGKATIALSVNGDKKGLAPVQFDENGQLCFDRVLLKQGGLKIPSALSADNPPGCYDYREAYPSTTIELRPGDAAIHIVTPTDALAPVVRTQSSGFTQGGTAGMLNYDVFATQTKYAGNVEHYGQFTSEAGFNIDDWIVRSRQLLSMSSNQTQFTHLYAYGQRTFADYKSILQVGQVNIGSSLFSGASVYGVQVLPELALAESVSNGAVVTGIAQTQARVEVRQAGALIYVTIVPQGPFSLSNLPLLNTTNDLDVTVIETNGSQRHFRVAAASLNAATLGAPQGYTFGMGRMYRRSGDNGPTPWLVTGTGGWAIGKNLNLSAGALVANQYQTIGVGADSVPLANTTVSGRGVVANDLRNHARGAKVDLSTTVRISEAISFAATASHQTKNFRDLNESLFDAQSLGPSNYRDQYTLSGTFSARSVGGFSVGYAQSNMYAGSVNRRLTGSWGKTFKHASVSLNVDQDVGSSYSTGNQIYVNATIPFGSRSVNTYASRNNNRMRYGVSGSDKINDYANYSMSAERDQRSHEMTFNGSLNLLPRYTQVDLSAGRYGAGTSYTGSLRGGIAFHQAGLTFSPYPIQDTFGIVSLDGIGGVKVQTPYGPVWTDWWGNAVVSTLPAYQTARIEVATKTLPRNVDIRNGFTMLNSGRGAVSQVDFGVVKVRRALLTAQLSSGAPLPKGSIVLDADDNFLTAAADNGVVFLANGNSKSGLQVHLPEGDKCRLEFDLPEKPDLTRYYETAPATCVAL